MCLVNWLTKSQLKTVSAQWDKHSKWSTLWLTADQQTAKYTIHQLYVGHRFPQFGTCGGPPWGTVPESLTCHIYICGHIYPGPCKAGNRPRPDGKCRPHFKLYNIIFFATGAPFASTKGSRHPKIVGLCLDIEAWILYALGTFGMKTQPVCQPVCDTKAKTWHAVCVVSFSFYFWHNVTLFP